MALVATMRSKAWMGRLPRLSSPSSGSSSPSSKAACRPNGYGHALDGADASNATMVRGFSPAGPPKVGVR